MDNEQLLYARTGDLVRRAQTGEPCSSLFLTPEEIALADEYLRYSATDVAWRFVGGYPDAERKMLVIYPDYLTEDAIDQSELYTAIEIRISGYVALDHRSYLGALMSSGVKRETLGDILCLSEGAVVFATPPVAEYLLADPPVLEYVGRDKVRIVPADPQKAAKYRRDFEERVLVVASMRLDCIVAETANLSREKAKNAVLHGDVRYNYKEAEDPAKMCAVGDVISVHGCGKIKINDSMTTRKGKIRLSVLVYR